MSQNLTVNVSINTNDENSEPQKSVSISSYQPSTNNIIQPIKPTPIRSQVANINDENILTQLTQNLGFDIYNLNQMQATQQSGRLKIMQMAQLTLRDLNLTSVNDSVGLNSSLSNHASYQSNETVSGGEQTIEAMAVILSNLDQCYFSDREDFYWMHKKGGCCSGRFFKGCMTVGIPHLLTAIFLTYFVIKRIYKAIQIRRKEKEQTSSDPYNEDKDDQYSLFKAVLVILIIACIFRSIYLLDFALIERLSLDLAHGLKIKSTVGIILAVNTFYSILKIILVMQECVYRDQQRRLVPLFLQVIIEVLFIFCLIYYISIIQDLHYFLQSYLPKDITEEKQTISLWDQIKQTNAEHEEQQKQNDPEAQQEIQKTPEKPSKPLNELQLDVLKLSDDIFQIQNKLQPNEIYEKVLTLSIRQDISKYQQMLSEVKQDLQHEIDREKAFHEQKMKDEQTQDIHQQMNEDDADIEKQPLIDKADEEKPITKQTPSEQELQMWESQVKIEKRIQRLTNRIQYNRHEIIINYQQHLKIANDEFNSNVRVNSGQLLQRKLENLENKIANRVKKQLPDQKNKPAIQLNHSQLKQEIQHKLDTFVTPTTHSLEDLKLVFDQVSFYKLKEFYNPIFESDYIQENMQQNQYNEEEFTMTLESMVKLEEVMREYERLRGVLKEVEKYHDEIMQIVNDQAQQIKENAQEDLKFQNFEQQKTIKTE
eukprot:403374704